jgi:hypothetical protein
MNNKGHEPPPQFSHWGAQPRQIPRPAETQMREREETRWSNSSRNPHHHSVIGYLWLERPRLFETHARCGRTHRETSIVHTHKDRRHRHRYTRTFLPTHSHPKPSSSLLGSRSDAPVRNQPAKGNIGNNAIFRSKSHVVQFSQSSPSQATLEWPEPECAIIQTVLRACLHPPPGCPLPCQRACRPPYQQYGDYALDIL